MKSLAALSFAFLGLIPACTQDETVAGYGAAKHVWQLRELDGQPFAAHATLQFPKAGQIGGEAPCNTYSADMTVPYPWFRAGPITATRMACDTLAEEQIFFAALAEMTLAEISGDVLLLSNESGRQMVFTSSAKKPE